MLKKAHSTALLFNTIVKYYSWYIFWSCLKYSFWNLYIFYADPYNSLCDVMPHELYHLVIIVLSYVQTVQYIG